MLIPSQLSFYLSITLCMLIAFSTQSQAAAQTETPTEESCMALLNAEKYDEGNQCLELLLQNLPELIVDPTEELLSKALDLKMDPDPTIQAQAVKYYIQAAQTNNPDAQVEMAMLYMDAELVPRDLEQAYYWLSKAAQQHYARGQLLLGRLYQSDQFSKKDGQQAIYWLTQAAQQDDRVAAEFLGDTYRDAILVPKDLKKALYWYKKSAKLGNNSALLQVALFYAHGYAVPKNPAKAEELLEMLVSPSTSENFIMIAEHYEHGKEGFPKDPAIAKHWYKKAAKKAETEKE